MARLASHLVLPRPEFVAGIGLALIVSGLGLRFLGSAIVLQTLALLRSVSDEAIALAIHAFSLVEILLGIGLLVLVAIQVRKRTRTEADSNNEASQQ